MAANDSIEKSCRENLPLQPFKIPQLKDYLRSCGQYVSGNKQELIDRVNGAYKLKIRGAVCENQSDSETEQLQQECKLTLPNGEAYKNPSSIKRWTDDVSGIPDVTDKDIYNYFVYKLGVKRQLKAKVMYEDRHVHKLQMNVSDENDTHCFVQANIIPSMPSASTKQCPDYTAWVMLSKVTGCIHSAECSCVAGFNGEGCNHVAALLYAIVDIASQRKEGLHSATSQKCKWNNPRKRKLSPQKSQHVLFKKTVHGKSETLVRRALPVYDVKTTVNVERFKQKLLAKNLNPGWLKNFQLESGTSALPKLHTICFNFHDSVNLKSSKCEDIFQNYFENLRLSEEQCVSIESLTRGQNNSDYWFDARHERLTTSNFGRICKKKEDTKPGSMLKDILGYRTFTSSHTSYGQKHEAAARRKYISHVKNEHPGLTVKKCGLLTTPELPYLGASPDGFVNCTHCTPSNGLIEIKCPSSMKWRMSTPEECAADKDFFCQFNQSGEVSLKRSHIYYYQVQGQLGISGREWCDFVVWTCVGISVERIYKDDKFFEEMIVKLKEFYMKAFIPELFSRRIERGVKMDFISASK